MTVPSSCIPCLNTGHACEEHPRDALPERWLPVPAYEGLYEVSDLGRVRSLTHMTPRGIRHGRTLRAPPNRQGYPCVTLYRAGVPQKTTVHLLVAAAFIGPCPPGREVRHLDGIKTCCARSNLAYGTRGENIKDQVLHGTHPWASKTHCPQNHEYTPGNTILEADGRRHCRTCARESSRRYRQRNPERDREQKRAWVERNLEFVRTQNRERARARRAKLRKP